MQILVGMVLGLLLSVPEPAEVQRAARVVMARDGFQLEHPRQTPVVEREPTRRRAQPTRRERVETPSEPVRRTPQRTRRVQSSSRNTSSEDGVLGVAIGWLVVTLAGLYITVQLVNRLRGGTTATRTPAPKTPKSKPIALAKALTAAQRFAATGAYNDAVHALLLDTLAELGRHIPSAVPRSFTSREILRQAPISDQAREALALLVSAVEATSFGHATATKADYVRCEEAWTHFAARVAAGTTTS